MHIIVDKNAIYENDRDHGDRPPLALYDGPKLVLCHEILVGDHRGHYVGKFCSQSAKTVSFAGRPHVWFEVEPGVLITPIHRTPAVLPRG